MLWAAGALLVLLCAVYANSFENAFHFDDFHTITDNPAVRSLHNVPRFFTDSSTFSVLPANRTYRPVVSASLAFDYAMGHGYTPFWFHLSTFVWFLLLVALLWVLYANVLDRTEPLGAWPSPRNAVLALVTAAWFGVHPAMAETVNYIIQRGDLYCTLGCVAALVLWAEFPGSRRFGLYLAPFALALLSKPPAAVFPILLFAFVFWFEAPERRWRTSALASLPSLAVAALGMMLQSAMTPKSFAPSIIDPWQYRLGQPFVWLRYCGELLLPVHLNVDSDLAPFAHVDARALVGLLFAAALIGLTFWAARQRRTYPIAFGLLWFFVTQVPTSAYALSEMENDHRMFLSFPGLMLAVVWGAWLLLQRSAGAARVSRFKPALLALAALLLCGYAWGAHLRNRVWRSEDTLWADDVAKSPHNGRGLMIYGLTLMQHGHYPEALDYFTRALQYTPNYATLEINLGVVNDAMGRSAEAERHFARAIALTPGDDQAHAFYARFLLAQGRSAEALAEVREAIRLNPSRPMQRDLLLTVLERSGDVAALHEAAAQTLAAVPGDPAALAALHGGVPPPPAPAADALNRSLAQYQAGEYQQSIASAQQALALDPGLAEAYNNIGASLAALGRLDDAIANEQKALALRPDLQIAKNNLALYTARRSGKTAGPLISAADLINRSLALNQQGKFEESIAAARAALRLDPGSAAAWNNIAAANEALHRWDDSIAAAQQALRLQPDFQLAKNNLAWSEQQKRLQQGGH